jgi:molybdenum cofactor biosynthesis protein B
VAGRIDKTLPFYPLRIAVLTVSDTRDEETDTSGGTLIQRLTDAGHELASRTIVTDDVDAIRAQVLAWVADENVDLILSTGGTGFSPRDVTPEAVKPLFRREMDGFSIVFHQASLGTVGVSTLQSRRDRSRTPSSSACPARPAPAATHGTSCSDWSSTAAIGRARWRGKSRA